MISKLWSNCEILLSCLRHRTLRPLQGGDQRIAECRHCHGVWFEDGSLNCAITGHHDHIEHYDHEQHLGPKLGVSNRQCTRCRVPMTHYQLLADYSVEIDCCPTCDGVWLDQHEVDQVIHSPLLKDALAELNKKVTWKSWCSSSSRPCLLNTTSSLIAHPG